MKRLVKSDSESTSTGPAMTWNVARGMAHLRVVYMDCKYTFFEHDGVKQVMFERDSREVQVLWLLLNKIARTEGWTEREEEIGK